MMDKSNTTVNQKEWVGGARLDISNFTWPLAKLTVKKELLALKVKFWGTLSFKPEEIIKIEPYGLIPFIGKGIKIHHKLNKAQYPEIVIFWFRDPKSLVEELHRWGFGTD